MREIYGKVITPKIAIGELNINIIEMKQLDKKQIPYSSPWVVSFEKLTLWKR